MPLALLPTVYSTSRTGSLKERIVPVRLLMYMIWAQLGGLLLPVAQGWQTIPMIFNTQAVYAQPQKHLSSA